MGGSSSGAPQYDEEAAKRSQIQAATLSQYGLSGPSGSVNWTGSFEDGTRKMEVNLSPFEQEKLDNAQNMLGSLSSLYGDDAAKRAENAVYNQFDQRYTTQFKQDKDDLHNQLINQGIPIGSDAYNKAMNQQAQSQNDARLQAANQSVLTGSQTKQNELAGGLSLFNTMQDTKNPLADYQGVSGIGTQNFESTYDKKIAADMEAAKIKSANQNAMIDAIGSMAGAGASMMMSDERVKENIEPVGKLDNGLTVYKFNFPDQPTQIGLIAQEVQEIIPEAVEEDEDGLLVVDYDVATMPIESDELSD